MGRTAVVVLENDWMEFADVGDWFLTDDGQFIGLETPEGIDIVMFNKADVKRITFRDENPEPPADYALGHKDNEKTGFSAGDRAVVIQPSDPWNCLTVDIVGCIADDPSLIVTKRRGEVACRLYHHGNLRPVPEERRNESR